MNENTTMLARVREAAVWAWRDERGAEGLEKVLILAAIVLPLLAVLIFFVTAGREWVAEWWDDVRSEADDVRGDDPFS